MADKKYLVCVRHASNYSDVINYYNETVHGDIEEWIKKKNTDSHGHVSMTFPEYVIVSAIEI